jgi:hypothetical protein
MLWVRISIRARCTTLCDKVYQWLATGRWFSPGLPVSSTNKTDHDITEMLLKVALNTIKQSLGITIWFAITVYYFQQKIWAGCCDISIGNTFSFLIVQPILTLKINAYRVKFGSIWSGWKWPDLDAKHTTDGHCFWCKLPNVPVSIFISELSAVNGLLSFKNSISIRMSLLSFSFSGICRLYMMMVTWFISGTCYILHGIVIFCVHKHC